MRKAKPYVPPITNDTFWPRGIEARITAKSNLLTTQFECQCENPQCLTTFSDMRFQKALDMVSFKLRLPITILRAMNCMDPARAKGKVLDITTVDNYSLLAWLERLYPDLNPRGIDEELSYIEISVKD